MEKNRSNDIMTLIRSGTSKAAVARKFGISVTRVSQIAKAHAKRGETLPGGLALLPRRTQNVLRSLGLLSAADVSAALAAGNLENIPNLGARGIEAIRECLKPEPNASNQPAP